MFGIDVEDGLTWCEPEDVESSNDSRQEILTLKIKVWSNLVQKYYIQIRHTL